jgi:hypothetical protein
MAFFAQPPSPCSETTMVPPTTIRRPRLRPRSSTSTPTFTSMPPPPPTSCPRGQRTKISALRARSPINSCVIGYIVLLFVCLSTGTPRGSKEATPKQGGLSWPSLPVLFVEAKLPCQSCLPCEQTWGKSINNMAHLVRFNRNFKLVRRRQRQRQRLCWRLGYPRLRIFSFVNFAHVLLCVFIGC